MIEYDFYQNPPRPEAELSDEPNYHVRPCVSSLISMSSLCEEISHSCSLSQADVMSVIQAIRSSVLFHLRNGHHIELGGLGILGYTIGGKVGYDKNKGLYMRNGCIDSITFRPERGLLRSLNNSLSFSRKRHRGHHSPDGNNLKADLKVVHSLLSDKSFFTSNEFKVKSQTTGGSCSNRLKQFCDYGVLTRVCRGVYQAGENITRFSFDELPAPPNKNEQQSQADGALES